MEFDSPKKIKKPKKSYFLGCFGFSIIEKELLPVNKSAKKKKNKSKLLSFSKIVRKHSSAAKTIPVDISDKFDNQSSREVHVVKSEKVKTPAIAAGDVAQTPAIAAGKVTQAPAVKSQSQTHTPEKDTKKTKGHKTKDIVHKNNKSLDRLLDNVRDISTCRNEFSRSVTISSTRNLNHLIKNSTKDKHEIKFFHSKSLSPPKQKKSMADTAIEKVDEKSSHQRVQVSSHDSFDSIIGVSILMVTLLIMLFWGKVCAIVCTCAWLYFLPQLRSENEAIVTGKIGGVAGDVDRNSEEYKKKVVLEGFLERNHRSGVGIL